MIGALDRTLNHPAAFLPAGISECSYGATMGPGQPREVTSETESSAGYFQYQGRQFRRTGEQWQAGRALGQVSQDGHRLAFVSVTGPRRPDDIRFFNPWAQSWSLYVDAYEISSGRKLATLVLVTYPERGSASS